MNRKWYAVYTRPQCEMKVVAALTRKKIESFCPHNRLASNSGNRRKMQYEPLFPTFVFVYIPERDMPEVRRNSDVINFVYWLGKPAVFSERDIEYIADFNGQYLDIKVKKTAVNILGTSRIGIFPGSTPLTARAELSLPVLGFVLTADTVAPVTTILSPARDREIQPDPILS